MDATRSALSHPHPGRNRQITVLEALEVKTDVWGYRLRKRSAAGFVALLK